MVVARITGVGFWILMTSVGVMGQQREETPAAPPSAPREKVVLGTYPSGAIAPWRRIEIRAVDGIREVLTQTIETPDIEGRFRSSAETITETVRSASDVVQMTRQVFGFGLSGERLLLETIRAEQDISPDGTRTIVADTWAPDVNGRPRLISRQFNQTDSQVAGVLRRQSTLFVSDVNGRLQPIEMRSQEVRANGSEYIDEEAIRQLDVNGALVLIEKTVIHGSRAGNEDRTTTETFSNAAAGMIQFDNRLELIHRVRSTRAHMSNGGLQTTEEVEERPAASPDEPIRVVRRTVETLRNVGDEQWDSDLQVFDLDVNGRFVLTAAQTAAVTR